VQDFLESSMQWVRVVRQSAGIFTGSSDENLPELVRVLILADPDREEEEKIIIMLLLTTKVLVAMMALLAASEARKLRRCFACRSRGVFGDCRDPFYVTGNSTALEHKSHGVETPPCASGWCSKILEDVDKIHTVDENYGGATQRDCLQRPPSDNKERCAYVTFNYKKVYMCFCRGDLCNSASTLAASRTFIILVPFYFLLLKLIAV
jgi:hypothetical protein